MDTPPRPFFRQRKNVTALLWLCLMPLLFSCHLHPIDARKADHSFYYWRSVFSLSGPERRVLKDLQVNKLYIRWFDVGWDPSARQAKPIAIIRFSDTSFRSFAVVPVVFITNETLTRMDTLSIPPLAGNIASLVDQLRRQNLLPPAREIQLDCDWTASTKDRYFKLINHIRRWLDDHQQKGCALSATIRLYQCKYREKTGVPPVDKGLLMCYNMGNLKDPGVHNSILETAELKKYTSHLSSYPLPLDVGLPVFDWKVLFHQQQFAGFVEALPTTALIHNPAVSVHDNYYTFLRDTSLENYAFEASDRLRDEQSDYATLSEAAGILSRRLIESPSTVVLFHLAPTNLSKYSTHELENIFNHFD